MDKGQQFPYEIRYTYNEPEYTHEYTAHHKGKDVGYMHVGEAGGIIDIGVHAEHRRKGVATAMWNHALKMAGKINSHGERIPYPEHSEHRTPSGDAWAKSTGPQHYFEPDEIHE